MLTGSCVSVQVAAGSERYGFWFQTPDKVTGPSVNDPIVGS